MSGVPNGSPPTEPPESPANESLVLRDIVRTLQADPGPIRSIDSLSTDFGVRKRALCDFISICAVFGICRRASNNTLEWYGLDHASHTVATIRTEARSSEGQTALKLLFNYSIEPSLSRIAVAVVKLFFFLCVQSLDLRRVGRLFAQKTIKDKTMIRKLYTVACGLEIAGIIRKTATVSEIQLVMPLRATDGACSMAIPCFLNTPTDLVEIALIEQRRKEFDEISATSIVPSRSGKGRTVRKAVCT
jgi:hypothetical protein